MARKQAKKVAPPEKPGRLVKGYGEHGESPYEHVEIELDDARVRQYGDRIKDLDLQREEKQLVVSEAKGALSTIRREIESLTHAVVYRTHEDRRRVWKFADDEKGEMSLYDFETHELLQVRPIEHDERQEEMDLDDDGGDEA